MMQLVTWSFALITSQFIDHISLLKSHMLLITSHDSYIICPNLSLKSQFTGHMFEFTSHDHFV